MHCTVNYSSVSLMLLMALAGMAAHGTSLKGKLLTNKRETRA